MTFYIMPSNSDLMHYGIKGQKWGIRRFQNLDGGLTSLGKKRYQKATAKHVQEIASKNLTDREKEKQILEEKKVAEKLASERKTLDNLRAQEHNASKQLYEYLKSKYPNDFDQILIYESDDYFDEDDPRLNRANQIRSELESDKTYKQYESKLNAYSEDYHAAIKNIVNSLVGQYGDAPLKSIAPHYKVNDELFYTILFSRI